MRLVMAGAVVLAMAMPAAAKPIETYHSLTLGKPGSKRTWALDGDRCTKVKDGTTTWYATGGARTWEGVRPPEGVDYQWYTLVRKR